MNKRTRALVSLSAGALVLVGTVVSAVVFEDQEIGPAPPQGESAVDGTVKGGLLVASPIGAPYVSANFRVTTIRSGAVEQEFRFWTGRSGSRYVRVEHEGSRETRNYLLPVRSDGFSGQVEEAAFDRLDGLPVLGDLPGLTEVDAERFKVVMWSVRPGDPVVLNRSGPGGQTDVAWVGDRKQYEASAAAALQRRQIMVARTVLGLALGAALVAFAVITLRKRH